MVLCKALFKRPRCDGNSLVVCPFVELLFALSGTEELNVSFWKIGGNVGVEWA